MPPLTTPTTAVLFMIMFFAVIMGVPFLILRRHHRSPQLAEVKHAPRKHFSLILPE